MKTSQPVVLITGASGGIGAATARAFARRQARLFLVGRQQDRLLRLAADLNATSIVADLHEASASQRVAAVVQEQAGRLDILVNGAGQLEVGPASDLGYDVVERLLRVNFLAAVATLHACLPLLQAGDEKVIVNVSSLAGKVAPPFMAAYAASKFALNGYTWALRQELRPLGIHVGLVLPGPVATPMVQGKLRGAYYPWPRGLPVLKPEAVAAAIVQVAERRLYEVVLPKRLGLVARLGAAFSRLVDHAYARDVRSVTIRTLR